MLTFSLINAGRIFSSFSLFTMASKYRKKFSLPENFYPILEDYSREVLRDQPMEIIEFCYLYFIAMEEVNQMV